MEAPGPVVSARKKMPPKENETKYQKMTRDDDSHGKGEWWGHNGDGGNNGGRPPRGQQGPGHRPREANWGKRTRDSEEESGTRRGAQRRAAEADGWRVGKKSRWTMIRSGRECGDRVRESGEAKFKATDGGTVGGEGTE